MEENTPNENVTNEENKEICDVKHDKNHCCKKFLGVLLAAFLGGFLAVYFVTDQIMERSFMKYYPPMPPKFEKKFMKDIDRMYEHDMKTMDNTFRKFDRQFDRHFDKMSKMNRPDRMQPLFTDPVKIKSELDDNKFNVFIDLKPFQNDESKVNYNVDGRKLTIFGKSAVKDKDFVQDISFSQDFVLPSKADIANITKTKDDNKLTITVPLK